MLDGVERTYGCKCADVDNVRRRYHMYVVDKRDKRW